MDALISDIRFAVRSLGSPSCSRSSRSSRSRSASALTSPCSASSTRSRSRPLPYADPDRLVDLHEWSATKLCAGCGVGTSIDTFRDWRRDARSFAGMGAYLERPFAVSGTETAERFGGARVSADVFDFLGIQPVLGRAFRGRRRSHRRRRPSCC